MPLRVLALPHGRRFYVLYTLDLAAARLPRRAAATKRGEKTGANLRPKRSGWRWPLCSGGDFSGSIKRGECTNFLLRNRLLDIDFSQPVYVVVDRLAIGPDMRSRLVDSVEICYREGRGEAILEFVPETPGGPSERMVFNERFECKTCGAVYQEPEPRLFSFNNPYGACPRCQGFGNTVDFDINLVIPDRGKSLNEGAIQPWTKPRYRAAASGTEKIRARQPNSHGRSLSPPDCRAAESDH